MSRGAATGVFETLLSQAHGEAGAGSEVERRVVRKGGRGQRLGESVEEAVVRRVPLTRCRARAVLGR